MMADPVAADRAPTEEVAFWRGFIVWWAREKAGPVPSRAWQALARAELTQAPEAMRDPGLAWPRYDR
jgi:hypothetical protein